MSAEPPAGARPDFPNLETAGESDLGVIERQLGRPPSGELFVAARCRHGRPTVILTMPFARPDGPAPPLLWLTCPHAVRNTSTLESGGAARRFAGLLEERAGDREELLAEERRFEEVQLRMAREVGEELACRLEGRGMAGGRPGDVKCLHAHLAYRLASGRGVVGGWCLEELVKEFGRTCDRIPSACVD